MIVSSDRRAVRTYGRNARRSVTGHARCRAEAQLSGHLRAVIGSQPESIGLFVAHDGEPALNGMVEWLWTEQRTPALPVLQDDPDDFTMRFRPWLQGDALVPGRYDIPVPPLRQAVVPDLLLVSLTAFDSAGNRIGRGGGFFDRYLASYGGAVVGVGFEAQRVASVPMEPHDQRLPVMVTDLGVRYFV